MGHVLSIQLMVTWLATFLSITVVQMKLSRNLSGGTLEQQGVRGTSEIFLACFIVGGFIWGLTGAYVVINGQLAEQVLIVAVISSLTIYAATHSSAVFGAFALYLLLLTTPSAVILIVSAHQLTRTLGVTFIILVAAGLVGGWRHYQGLCRSAHLEVEVEELTGVVRKLKTRLELGGE